MENETKLCKHCKSEIPKGAKVCPNCRKKQGGIGKWIVIVVVVVIIIAAMSGGGADKPKKVENASTQNNTDNKADVVNDTTEDTSVKQEDSEKDIFGIGETAEMNDVQVTMVNYTQSSGSEYNKPADGNEFVLVEFEIANNSDSEINISSMASFEAYADDYALNYSVSALLEKNDQNQLDGTIAAGKKMNGVIGYEVPADWKTIEIHFKDNVWSSNVLYELWSKTRYRFYGKRSWRRNANRRYLCNRRSIQSIYTWFSRNNFWWTSNQLCSSFSGSRRASRQRLSRKCKESRRLFCSEIRETPTCKRSKTSGTPRWCRI